MTEENSREPLHAGYRQQNRMENGVSDNSRDVLLTADEALNAAGVGIFQVKLIVLSGFVWMARGFEFVIQLYTSSLITCTWNLQRWQGALMDTIVIWFTIIGCFLFGIWSDKYGRRTALSSSLIFLCVFGAVSAGLPTYTWFVVFRAVTGFAVGGLPQTLVLCCEYMPSRQRGRAIFILSLFWALGVVVMLSVLYTLLEDESSWRIYVAIGALPSFMAMVMMRFFPESFRYLMVTNQYFVANEIFEEMSESNGVQVPGKLKPLPERTHRSITIDLLSPPFVRPTLLFWLIGLGTAITFLGLDAMTPHLILHGAQGFDSVNATAMNFLGSQYSMIPCMKVMTTEDFVFTTWTTSLDFPGFVIYLILVDVVDRKKLLCASYFISSIFIFLLFVPAPGTIIHVVFVYCARILVQSQYDLLLLMTAERFPTSHRGTAVGLATSSFYLGQFLSSYLAHALPMLSLLYPIILYGILPFFCGVATLLLKSETRGKDLQDIIQK